jgi:hypothetical protein
MLKAFFGGLFGAAIQHQTYDSNNASVSKNLLTYIDTIKLSAGYHGERFFSVLGANADLLSIKVGSRYVNTSTTQTNLIFGVHF